MGRDKKRLVHHKPREVCVSRCPIFSLPFSLSLSLIFVSSYLFRDLSASTATGPLPLSSALMGSAAAADPDPAGAQSSVQQFLQEMMMSNGISLGLGDMAGGNAAGGYGNIGSGPSVAAGGIRAVMGNNSFGFNRRVAMDPAAAAAAAGMSHQQQDLGSRLLSGNFNNHQFGWKTSP